MAFNFPASPTEGQIFTDATSGAQYVFRNGVWMQSSAAQIRLPASGKNLVINPGFQISQEQGFVGVTTSGVYLADQWQLFHQGMTSALGQATLANGRGDAAIRNTAVVAVPGATAQLLLWQALEGWNINELKWGTADAVPAVLSFEANANQVGVYSVCVRDDVASQSFVFDINLPTADTWAKFSVPIPARTSGTWQLGQGVRGGILTFGHTVGSSFKAPAAGWNAGNFFAGPTAGINSGVINNNLYIRNVQLRADPGGAGINPEFQMPNIADEFVRCQRYWQQDSGIMIVNGYASAGGAFAYEYCRLSTRMRVAPTFGLASFSNSNANNATSGGTSPDGMRFQCSAVGVGPFYSTFTYTLSARM